MKTPTIIISISLVLGLSSLSFSAPTGDTPHNVFLPLPHPAHGPRVFHTQTLLPDGRVLLAGGFSDLSGILPLGNKDLELFNPKTLQFTLVGAMPTIRAAHTATVLPDGRVLFIGGSPSPVVEVFSPATGKLSPLGHILKQRSEHTASLLPDGQVLITGGVEVELLYRDDGFHQRIKTTDVTELFDPRTGVSRVLRTDLPIHRRGHTQTLLRDGTVLIAGGDPSGRLLLFDPATAKVRNAGKLVTPRWDHRATLLSDGRVLFTGGTFQSKSLTTAEIYDPVRQRSSPLATLMSVPREDHTATLLPDGRVLITGGENNQAGPGRRDLVHRAADLFDPARNVFTKLTDLNSERDDHRATLLLDGRVFIFGGQTTKEKVLHSGELFIP